MTEEEKRLQQSSFDKAVELASGPAEKPSYAGSFDNQLQDIYDRIQNREQFNYDMNADPLYQMYKDSAVQGGRRAMRDTMGQAAALTGGYGSSYGQGVGQQRYDQAMEQLSAMVPQLYGQAYQQYRDRGTDLQNQYSMLGDMRDTEYNRYLNELNQYNTEENRRITEENNASQRQQQAYSNLVAMIRLTGYSPSDEELQEAGVTRDMIESLRHQYYVEHPDEWAAVAQQMGLAPAVGAVGGVVPGGTYNDPNTAQLQRQLNAMGAGLQVDGIWGEETQRAYERLMGGGAGAGTGTGATSDEAAYLQYLIDSGVSPGNQTVQAFARAHGLPIPEKTK